MTTQNEQYAAEDPLLHLFGLEDEYNMSTKLAMDL